MQFSALPDLIFPHLQRSTMSGAQSTLPGLNIVMSRLKLISALVLGTFALAAQAATSEAWVATTTKAHDPRSAVHVAPLKAGAQMQIVVSLKLRNKTRLDTLTSRLMSGDGSVKPLTPEQFKAEHAPTAAQVESVVTYLRAHGFVNIEVADNNLLVSATGGAGSIKTAFRAELHEYDAGGRSAYANVTDAQVPAHLGDTVLGVLGLQNVHMAHTFAKRMAATNASAPESVTGVSIPNFPSIYDAASLPSATTAAIGIVTVGSVTQTITDLRAFATKSGYPMPVVSTTVVGQASDDTSGQDEWNLDSQSALGAAGGTIRTMILYDANNFGEAALGLAYNRAVTDNKAKVVNVSLGLCESDAVSFQATQDQIFQTAVSQGQTFSVSSGDSGAYECGETAGKAQSYPAVSPYVMAIGGTALSTTGGTAWAAETTWGCTSAATCQQSSSGGAGGGPSLTESAPSWQLASGVLGTSTMRGVPDISFDAAPGSGALVLLDGSTYRIGGTSLAAPLFAGFWARIQSANGNALPFPASTLYQGAAANPTWFHDVTTGSQGYSAAAGWDYATGYGSLKIANFAQAFTGSTANPIPTANFTFTVAFLTASFTDASSDINGTIHSYKWNFGDGSSAANKSPVHTYSAAGTYTVTETVTDSDGATSSKSATVTATVSGAGQLIVNGGFESSATPWRMNAGMLCTKATCGGKSPYDGTGFALFDGHGSSHTDIATQSVTIPAGVTTATLSFHLYIATAETGSTPYDRLFVQVLNSTGSVAATLATFSNADAAPGYRSWLFNMAPFIGKSVQIRFVGVEDSMLATSFQLDDVSLVVH